MDRTLRVEGRPDVFAVGDVNDVGELKVTPAALAQAEVAAHNIRTYLNTSGRHGKEPRSYRAVHRTPMIVPFGPSDGVTMVPVPGGQSAVLGSRMTTLAKAKTLMTPFHAAPTRLHGGLTGRPGAVAGGPRGRKHSVGDAGPVRSFRVAAPRQRLRVAACPWSRGVDVAVRPCPKRWFKSSSTLLSDHLNRRPGRRILVTGLRAR